MNNIQISCTINESLSTHYLIYKITNNINGKYYIGQHKTNDIYDNYMGSGKLILEAEDKYGLSAFTKTILFDFDNFDDMNNKEKELVQLSNCYPNDQMSYNIQSGGKEHQMSEQTKKLLSIAQSKHQKSLSPEKKNIISKAQREIWENKSDDEKEKIKEKCRNASSGKNNPMYGHSCTEYMSEDKIKRWKDNISKATKDKNNPMYNKSIFDFMTDSEINQWRTNQKLNTPRGPNHPCYGKN